MPFFPPSGGASGTTVPAPNAVPESLGSSLLAPGWLPPPAIGIELYCSPDGDDDNPGTEFLPKQYLRTCWDQLADGGNGGGTIHVADETSISADDRGMFISGGNVTPVNSTVFGAIYVKKWAVGGTPRGFVNNAPARIYGGAVYGNDDQDDPCLWISNSTARPMCFQDIRFQDGSNKGIRIGWDYQRDTGGNIIKRNVTHAARASGSTVFTVDPYTFNLCKISRTANVVNASFTLPASIRGMPTQPGVPIYIDFTSGDFTPGWYTVLTVTNDTINFNTVTFASTGADFTTGSIGGPNIGTGKSVCVLPKDNVTLYATAGMTGEFPSSQYKVTAVSQDTFTVNDYYGYGTRSATASADNIGTYAAQDRGGMPVARLAMWNVSGSPQRDDNVTDRFVNGPYVDIANLEFYDFRDCFFDGFNIKTVDGVQGCRDPERRPAVNADPGAAAAILGFGQLIGQTGSYGGIRYHGTPSATGFAVFKNVLSDTPVGSTYISDPTFSVPEAGPANWLYLESISNPDATEGVPTISIADGISPRVVVVNGVIGHTEGPCTGNFGPPINYSTPLNLLNQAGYYGDDNRISGRHPAAARACGIMCSPLQMLVSDDPGDWLVGSNVTVTSGIRDPWGGTKAFRFTASATDQVTYRARTQTSTDGEYWGAAIWARGDAGASQSIDYSALMIVDNNTHTQHFMSKKLKQPAGGGTNGEWQPIFVGGKLSNLPGGSIATITNFLTSIAAGFSIDICVPQLYLLTTADPTYPDLSDAELAEIMASQLPTPHYLDPTTSPNVVGTHVGKILIGHGGLGTNAANAKTVGVGSGQLTLTGSGTVYLPSYSLDGTTIIGWVAQLQATINP